MVASSNAVQPSGPELLRQELAAARRQIDELTARMAQLESHTDPMRSIAMRQAPPLVARTKPVPPSRPSPSPSSKESDIDSLIDYSSTPARYTEAADTPIWDRTSPTPSSPNDRPQAAVRYAPSGRRKQPLMGPAPPKYAAKQGLLAPSVPATQQRAASVDRGLERVTRESFTDRGSRVRGLSAERPYQPPPPPSHPSHGGAHVSPLPPPKPAPAFTKHDSHAREQQVIDAIAAWMKQEQQRRVRDVPLTTPIPTKGSKGVAAAAEAAAKSVNYSSGHSFARPHPHAARNRSLTTMPTPTYTPPKSRSTIRRRRGLQSLWVAIPHVDARPPPGWMGGN